MHQEELKGTYFYHLGRRNKEGVPVASNVLGPYARHVGNVEAYLFTTQESLDRAREKLDTRTHQLREARQEARTYKRKRNDLLQKYDSERKDNERLRKLLPKEQNKCDELEKAYTELTDRLEELEDDGEELQAGTALLSDNEDYESDAPDEVAEHEMADFVVVDGDEEDPEEPSWNTSLDDSSDDSR